MTAARTRRTRTAWRALDHATSGSGRAATAGVQVASRGFACANSKELSPHGGGNASVDDARKRMGWQTPRRLAPETYDSEAATRPSTTNGASCPGPLSCIELATRKPCPRAQTLLCSVRLTRFIQHRGHATDGARLVLGLARRAEVRNTALAVNCPAPASLRCWPPPPAPWSGLSVE